MVMQFVTDASIKKANHDFRRGLKNLVQEKDGKYSIKACIICDRLLTCLDTGAISKRRLRQLTRRLCGIARVVDMLPEAVKEHYTYRGCGDNELSGEMLLSPAGIYDENSDSFLCCRECKKMLDNNVQPSRIELPKFAIANGMALGTPPNELERLNEVELALIAKARIDKHVFALFGGAHKQMVGWHNMYENNTNHVGNVMHVLGDFGVKTTVACILMGPFTKEQRAKAWKETQVRPSYILEALLWLKQNNPFYADYNIPSRTNIPQPIIIDKSEIVASQNSDIEKKMEYTVVFPETNNITAASGSCMTKEDFKKEVLDALDSTTTVTLLSSPTRESLRDNDGTTLIQSSPLQFPYGCGGPIPTGNKNKVTAGAKIDYIRHLQQLAVPSLHKPAFVLVLHCMYERHKALTNAFLRCKTRIGSDSTAEVFSELKLRTLQSAFACAQSGVPVRDAAARRFLRDLDYVCKSMGHTNDAAKKARLHMFANMIRFGPAALFLSVTPDDGNSFRLKVYVEKQVQQPPSQADCNDTIDEDIDLTFKMRQEYPGLCAFEFQEITDLIVEHVLGWDTNQKCSKPSGGAFGTLSAWCTAVEEQGRKTLHHHWIIWVDQWSSLLEGLHAPNDDKRLASVQSLERYIDQIMCNSVFAQCKSGSRIQKKACHHVCDREHRLLYMVPPDTCSYQDLRNLRYAQGVTSFGQKAISRCPICGNTLSTTELKDNAVSTLLGTTENVDNRLRLAVKRFAAQIDCPTTPEETEKMHFLVGAMQNLHDTMHKKTCFKRGYECRFAMPTRPCSATRTHYDPTKPMSWWTWTGKHTERQPYLVEQKRHMFDVFTNTHSPLLSNSLGCNTNLQCGIAGAHIMYVTMYASKGTQTDDCKAYINVAAALYGRLRKQEQIEHQEIESTTGNSTTTDAPNPFSEGYRRLLSAVFSHTKAHVTSAPLAWFIVRNGGRFIFSHECSYLPLDAFMGIAAYSRVDCIGQSLYIVNKMEEYRNRPLCLQNVCLYDYTMQYKVVHGRGNDEEGTMPFLPTYSQHGIYCLTERDVWITPLLSHTDFPTAAAFEGENLLDDRYPGNSAMEQFAKVACTLFLPFRNKHLHDKESNASFLELLRTGCKDGSISISSQQRLKNVQDCKNMLKAGRQQDMLERVTLDVPGFKEGCKVTDDSEAELQRYIEETMTDVVSEMDTHDEIIDNTRDHAGKLILLMSDEAGKRNTATKDNIFIKPIETLSTEPLYDLHDITRILASNITTPPVEHSSFSVERLARLLCVRTIRKVDNRVSLIPTGTVDSIQEWANKAFSSTNGCDVDPDQKRAFEVIVSKFVLTYFQDAARAMEKLFTEKCKGSKRQRVSTRSRANITIRKEEKKLVALSGIKHQQLIMFLTGAGGAGKSRVISQVLSYGQGFCKHLGVQFDKRTIVVTALTGVAATMIDGETTSSAAHLQREKITGEHIDEWRNARLMIVDEVSFAGKELITSLHDRLGQLKERRKGSRYGGIHLVFAGDFSQLEPVRALPLYCETNFCLWHDWINCCVELKGQHRMKNDTLYAGIMENFRNGTPTKKDFDIINSRVVQKGMPTKDGPSLQDIPSAVSYAVYTNATRAKINNIVFKETIKGTHSTSSAIVPPKNTLIILSDLLTWQTNKKPVNAAGRHSLWAKCDDSQVETATGRPKYVDTCLKLYTGIPMMYMENDEVENKKANGTLCYLKKVVLHNDIDDNQFEVVNVDGYYVRAIGASCVKHLVCSYNEGDIEKEMIVEARMSTCRVNMPLCIVPGEEHRQKVRMVLNRFPVLVNHATTGHKLQGQTKHNGVFIKEWNYNKNWPYVVLSRVTCLNKLFLHSPIDTTRDYKKDNRLLTMMTRFRKKKPVEYVGSAFEEWW